MKGSQWSTRLEILKSIKDAVHEGELRKGDVLNPYRIHKLTGKDIRIAKEHAPSLVGENVNGKLATLDPDAGPWLLIDDPSDEWLDAKVDGYLQTLNSGSVEVERPPKTDNTEILLAAGGIIAAPILISLLSWAIINHEQIAQQIQEGWDNLCRRWNDFGA